MPYFINKREKPGDMLKLVTADIPYLIKLTYKIWTESVDALFQGHQN